MRETIAGVHDGLVRGHVFQTTAIPGLNRTLDEARAAGERIGVDWDASPFGLEQFRAGMAIEFEHGTHDPETNVTDDDAAMTAKIARAHLNEFPDYYTRLAKMETEAEEYWGSR